MTAIRGEGKYRGPIQVTMCFTCVMNHLALSNVAYRRMHPLRHMFCVRRACNCLWHVSHAATLLYYKPPVSQHAGFLGAWHQLPASCHLHAIA